MTHALSAADILATWERAANAHPVDRSLAILATWRPDLSHEAIVTMSLGGRDALLIRARQATFGDSLAARSSCPSCHETIEFDLSCSALRVEACVTSSEIDLEAEGVQLRARLLDSSDLASIAGCDVDESRRRLISRCVLHASRDGIRVA